jgi:hypothetical protein
VKRFLIIAYVSIIVGCATQPPVVQSGAELHSTHGFVHVVLPNATPADTIFVTLRSLDNGTEYAMSKRDDASANLGLWIPAGKYEVAEMVGRDKGSFLPIEVRAGRLTDLGGLAWFAVGGYERVLLPFRHPEFEERTKSAITQNLPYLYSADPIEWNPQAPPKAQEIPAPSMGLGVIVDLIAAHNRSVNTPSLNKRLKDATTVSQFFAVAKTATPPLKNEPAIDMGGNLYYGAELGQVRVRRPDGHWDALDTGTLQPISSVASNGNNRLIAGSRDGVIRVSDDKGATWHRTAQLGPDEAILDIDQAGTRWLVTTGHLANPRAAYPSVDQIKVYTTPGAELSDLVQANKVVLSESLEPYRQDAIRGQVVGNYYFLNTVFALWRFDLASNEWKNVSPGHTVTRFRIAPNTRVITAFKNQGIFSKLSVSDDNGESWHAYATPPIVVDDIHFDTIDKAEATRWNPGMWSVTLESLKYDPLRKDWIKIGAAPEGACAKTLRNGDNHSLFCVSSGGSIFRFDSGTLTAEFAVN